ncbi:siderophore-iron reductase FhuF [Marinobacter sp.]|uniref:siderophore-iron reductase FhuF n=1 Tax=Marinobacter sp. TaxID=50741 RepID=UPI00356325CC
MTIPALAPLFVGDFAHYRDVLVLPGQDQRPGIPAQELVTADGLQWVLSEYRRSQPGDDERALLSLWSRYYFVKLTVPVVGANLMLGRELTVGLDGIEVILGEGGVPEAFRLPDEGRPFRTPPADGFERFRNLLEENFAPLIDGWCRQVKVSRRVLWNNAANYFEWLIRTLESTKVPQSMLADGQQVVEAPRYPDGRPNPMASPVRYVEQGGGDEPLRQRRHCCIRYRLPDLPLCRNCPHIDRPPKGALLPGDD